MQQENPDLNSESTVTSHSYAQLDLDALEREYAEAETSETYKYEPYGDDRILILIQRLRELENNNGALLNIDRVRNEILRQAEGRIAQLERVREAADQLYVASAYDLESEPYAVVEARVRLAAALSALTSETKAQSETSSANPADTAHKAG